MVVQWRVEAMARGSSAVPNRYDEEDDRVPSSSPVSSGNSDGLGSFLPSMSFLLLLL